MKRTCLYILGSLGLTASALVLSAVMAGCEDNAVPDNFNAVPNVSKLSIRPSSVSLDSTNTFAIFIADGGTPPYIWTASDASLGTLPSTTAGSVTYTRVTGKSGINVITVVDRNEWSATATVLQQ